jgi:hypothetical protein
MKKFVVKLVKIKLQFVRKLQVYGAGTGRRKYQKVGGAPVSRSTFGVKRAPKKFSRKCWQRGKGGGWGVGKEK